MSHTFSIIARRFFPLFILAACADGTSPDALSGARSVSSPTSSLLGSVLDPGGVISSTIPEGFLVTPALRLTPLVMDVSWSFVAGPLGATSSNAASGLTVVVPANALSTTQTITVTALAGPTVAYRFEPHGLQFDHQVLLYQALSALATSDKHLRGAYFPNDVPEIDPLTGLTIVTELVPTKFDKKSDLVRIKIRHFSGYIVASGRSGVEDGDTSGDY